MKKENFICPCCGLPNHLEFQSEEDYNKVRKQESTGIVGNINTIFNKYLVGSGDGRTSTNETKLELKARLERIQQISNRFNDLTFQQWFDRNVVCFINEQGNAIWQAKILSLVNTEEIYEIPIEPFNMEEVYEIPIEPLNIEEITTISNIPSDIEIKQEYVYELRWSPSANINQIVTIRNRREEVE